MIMLIFLFCVGLIFLLPFSGMARKILGTIFVVLCTIFLGYAVVLGILLLLI